MSPDHGEDFYTPEEKREMYHKLPPLEPALRDRVAGAIGGTVLVLVWIGTLIAALVIGTALLKWAIEELSH